MKFTKRNLHNIKARFAEQTGVDLCPRYRKVPDLGTVLPAAMDHKPRTGRIMGRKTVLLAAVLALLCSLSVTALAVNLFGIRDMLMESPGGTYVTITGYQNSPEFQALMEWDAKRPKSQPLSDPIVDDPVHHQYGAYTEEAKQTLDAILEKYGLQPYSRSAAVYDGDPQSLYDAVGEEGFLPESCADFRGTTDPDSPGCSVRSGISIFSFSDVTKLADGTQIQYEFNNCAKGYMPIFMGLEVDLRAVTEWMYTAKDGTGLLLWSDDHSSTLQADLPNSFLTISAWRRDDSGSLLPLSKAQLEEFSELFDFSVIRSIRAS